MVFTKNLENLPTDREQTDNQAENSKTEAALILWGSSGERANTKSPLKIYEDSSLELSLTDIYIQIFSFT